MEETLIQLQECVKYLDSNKITDRKKGTTDLKELLERDDVIQTLNRISKDETEDSSCSWNKLFVISHKTLLMEIDRYRGKVDNKNQSTRENNKLVYSSLVSVIVKRANAVHTYIQCGSIIDAVIYVLDVPHYRKEIGSTYVNILYENVLPVAKYWGAIKLVNWKALFELCINLFENPVRCCKTSTIIAIMNLIVKHGCEHSSLIVIIKKKIFTFLRNVIQMAVRESVDFQAHTLKLVLITWQKLQKECRMTICKFSEEIFNRLIDMCRTLVLGAAEKKQFLIDILLIMVKCHHPDGVVEQSESAYAHNWNEWNKKLQKLNHFVNTELDNKHGKLQQLPSNFIKLAVEIYNQIFRCEHNFFEVTVNTSMNESVLTGNTIKRRRITCGFTDMIDRLKTTSHPIDMCPWLSVISSLISKYPKLVNERDYTLLLPNICKFLSSSKEGTVTDYLCQCCIALIDVRQNAEMKIDYQEEETVWDSIWNIVLRTIGLNQNTEWSHKLLQHMIKYKWKPTMGNSVLKLYLSQVVRLSTPSLLTLYHLRLRISFPVTILDIPVHSTLLRWLLPVTSEYSLIDLQEELYAHTIALICLRNNVKKVSSSLAPFEFDFSCEPVMDAALIHKLTSYSCDIQSSECRTEENVVLDTEHKKCVLNEDAFEQVLNLVEDHMQSLLEICDASSDKLMVLSNLSSFILFVVHLQRFEDFYEMNSDTTRLKTVLEKVLGKFLIVTENLLVSENNINELIKLLTYLSGFFQKLGTLSPHLIEVIINNFFALLQPVFDYFENTQITDELSEKEKESIPENENDSLFEIKTLPKHDRLKLEACRLLVYYSFNRVGICENQYKIIERVLEILIDVYAENESNEYSRVFLIMSVFTVQTVMNLKKPDLTLFSYSIDVIKWVCCTAEGSWCRISESVLVLLKLIQQGIEKSHLLKDTSQWQKFTVLIQGISTIIPDCGTETVLEMARCLSLFKIRYGNDLNELSDEALGILVSTSSDLLEYLQHPFHEVRVAVISWLPSIFMLIDQMVLKNRVSINTDLIVDNFNKSLFGLFIVDDMTDDEIDETVNRTLTVLYSLANAIYSSRTTRRQQIFSLFYVTHEKRLNRTSVAKILKLVGKRLKLKDESDLIKDNLVFVLFSWYTKYKSFENFPFEALKCNSMPEFLKIYLKEVVVVLLFMTDIKKLEEVSNLLKTPLQDIVKECFPEIMAVSLKKITEARKFNCNPKAAEIVNNFVESILTSDGIEILMVEKLADVLTSILRHLHDVDFEIMRPNILPMSTQLVSNVSLIRETVRYLQETAGTDTELIIYIANHYPKFIQKIFQKLYADVMQASTAEIKLESLQKYILFCELLVPHYEDLAKCQMSAFIARTIIKNLLCFLSSNEADIVFLKSTLRFYLKFISQWLSEDESYAASAAVFSECLSTIVEQLVLFVSQNSELAMDSLNILRFLLGERSQVLSTSIAKLEQFPDHVEFEEFRSAYLEMQETQTEGSSLRDDIKLFLNASENSVYSPCRVESLKYLRKQLSANKWDLIDLFRDCASQTSHSDASARTIAHCLICTLIEQTKCKDEKVKYEAVCCLSEIGLVDLHTMVLKPNCDSVRANCSPEFLITEKICTILKDCIVDEDVDLVNAGCRVLYRTLFSLEGFQVVSGKMSALQRSFMFPFVPVSSESVEKKDVWQYFSLERFHENVDHEFLWLPLDETTYTRWIQNLVAAVCNSFAKKCFLNGVQTVCQLKISIAETIFKYLVNLLTACKVREPAAILGSRVNDFLNNYFSANSWENLPNSFSSSVSSGKKISNSIYNDKSSVQCLLDVANFVRLNQKEPDNNDLNLNYLYISKAALHCNAYFTSIFYAELHLNSLIKNHDVPYDGNILSYLEEIGSRLFENQNDLLNILREAFSKIGDSDALYGCGSSLLLHSETRILHYQQIENWQRVFELCDMSLASNPSLMTRVNDLTSAVGNSGFNYLQSRVLSSLEHLNPQLRGAQYQSGWKLATWDIEEPCNEDKTFNYYQYAALKDIHQRNYEGARMNVQQARKSILHNIARIGLESTKNVYHVLAKLQCLQDIENFTCVTDVNDILDTWRNQDTLSVHLNFSHRQMIFNQRVRMVDANEDEARNFILIIAKLARRERNFNFAESCLSMIKNKEPEPGNLFQLKVCFEEARVLWDREETYVARYLIKDLLKKDETKESHTFHATLLRIYGKWQSEINLENADTIFNNYFLPAADLVPRAIGETRKERRVRLKTYRQVAEFADRQYQQIAEYIKSDVFEEQIKSVHESKKTSEALGEVETYDLKKSKASLANQSKMDDSQVKEIQNKEKRYLILALKYYLKVLAECDEEDLKVFRMISFWLHQKTNTDVQEEVQKTLFHIPSYKFVSTLPQLMAHVTRNTNDGFGELLNKLLMKCARDHPHHTLPLIFSLVNYTKGDQFENVKPTNSKEKKKNDERVNAASDLIRKLRSEQSIRGIVGEMEELNEAYIEFAYHILMNSSRSTRVGAVVKIPAHLRISKIVNLENTFCPTITVPINKSAKYDEIIGIRKVENQFTNLPGVNAPKKISCVCTDGKIRRQLVKGKDDMRVDAVMQQVFTIMNKLLTENKHTSKRKLLLRTYKVVPLSQRSGVLEFCEDTISLGEYLCYMGDSHPGAHRRFRPQDILTSDARVKLREVKVRSNETKLKVFENVCRNLKPVFRYFFIEKFPSPAVWFERKLAYIHSVATTSMVGYILGIGDRHVQNMLIDQKSAELIHIDFGIAFDQGLVLNCPERIPFRLTRDIEDGMGIFSIDGIFRRCCEQVMIVLRENSEIIRTTSEVFIHDPLYLWTLTPEKRDNVKSTSKKKMEADNKDAETNITAARALSRLKLKLQGMDNGTPTNVEGQINRLIQQAKDFRNLSVLFEGWQAYL